MDFLEKWLVRFMGSRSPGLDRADSCALAARAPQWLHLAVTGLLMHAIYLGGVWMAIKAGMGSGLSALIVGLQPVLTALWISGTSALGSPANATARNRVTARQWMGLVPGLGGLLLVVSRKFGSAAAKRLCSRWLAR